ncbi:MAG: thioredoxin family protein [Acidimicrobiia bacterium]
MDITLQYFDSCPGWKLVEADLETLESEGVELTITHQLIETPEAAAEAGFRGSPTVLIDGVDPFADPDAPVGLSCRVYRTDDGFAGSPTLEQLRTAVGEG